MATSAMLKLLALPWFYGARHPVRTAVSSRASSQCPIHPDLMKVLVCPLSKEPLRYEPSTNELVCDKLGMAYPIVLEGDHMIPNLVPEDGRRLLPHSSATLADASNIDQKPETTKFNNSTHSEPQT